MNRREFNKTMVAATGLGIGVATGLVPLTASADYPTSAFDAENMDDAMNALFGTTEAEETDAITFKAPEIAENGAVVPITINADLDNAANYLSPRQQQIWAAAQSSPEGFEDCIDRGLADTWDAAWTRASIVPR